MSISMYSASVPVFTTALRNLSHFLDKTRANAEARKFDTGVLMAYRLAPRHAAVHPPGADCLRRGQAVCGAYLGRGSAKFEDTETTLDELQARIQKTIDYLATVKPEQMDGTEDKEVVIPAGGGKTRTMTAEGYLKHWATPNMYFHVTMAYAILRHNGVDLGKSDFLAGAGASA